MPGGIKCGAIAQLGERLNGIQEVVGSIPIGSTNIETPAGSGQGFFYALFLHEIDSDYPGGCTLCPTGGAGLPIGLASFLSGQRGQRVFLKGFGFQ